ALGFDFPAIAGLLGTERQMLCDCQSSMGRGGIDCRTPYAAGGWNCALRHGPVPQPEKSGGLCGGLFCCPHTGKKIFEGWVVACVRSGHTPPYGILCVFSLRIVTRTGEIRKQTAHIRVAASVWTFFRAGFPCLQRSRALSWLSLHSALAVVRVDRN